MMIHGMASEAPAMPAASPLRMPPETRDLAMLRSHGAMPDWTTRKPVLRRISSNQEVPEAARKIRRELKTQTQRFESLFLSMLMGMMREAGHKSDLFHGGRGEAIFQKQLDAEYAAGMAKSGGIGLGDFLYNDWVWQAERIARLGGDRSHEA